GPGTALPRPWALAEPSRSVSLTTMLTHASGEWIASEWPVCPVSDTAAPHRMGTALTYARRYALFTLVGIAGEDDLDAPDLNCKPVAETGARPPGRGDSGGRGRPILDPEASAEARDRLLREIVKLGSGEAAGEWARNILPIKNTLTARDARLIETAFAFRMSALQAKTPEPEPPAPTAGGAEAGPEAMESADQAVHRRRRNVPPTASTRASSRSEKRGAFATRSTSSTSLPDPASFAGDSRP